MTLKPTFPDSLTEEPPKAPEELLDLAEELFGTADEQLCFAELDEMPALLLLLETIDDDEPFFFAISLEEEDLEF